MNASSRAKLSRWSAIMLIAAIMLLLPTFASAKSVVLDFDTDGSGAPVVVGQVLDDEWNNAAYGNMVISSPTSASNPLVAFDSSAPTGGDLDLGSPNTTCPGGGPGIGSGGEVGAPFENCIPLGNLIIIEENCDSSNAVGGIIDYAACGVPGPDDNVAGGTVNFTFGTTELEEVVIDSFELLDFEDAAGAGGVTVNAYSFTDQVNPIFSFPAPAIGDNGSAVVDVTFAFGAGQDPLPWPGVSRLEFVLEGSGSVGTLAYTHPGATAISLDTISIASDATYFGVVAVLMLGALAMSSLALFRRETVSIRA